MRVTSGPPAGQPAAEGKRGRCRRLPCSCQCVLTSRASAPPFKQRRRRRRRRRRRKQQLSGSGPGCGRLRRDPSATERSPRLRGPHSPPPPPAGKGVPRPRPNARADTPPRGPGRDLFLYWQPEKMPEPKRRAAWQALSLRRPPAGGRKGGREGGGRHGCAEESDAHGAAAQALFSGAGWAEMEVSFYVAEIGNK